jgi:hypothetical protein
MRGQPGQRAPKRPVITAYDGEGGFAFRLEHPVDVEFMTRLIMGGLAKISEEQEKRRRQASADAGGDQREDAGATIEPAPADTEHVDEAPAGAHQDNFPAAGV